MKIAATGDIHLTDGARFHEVVAVMDWIAADAINAAVDLFLIGGDIAGHDAPHAISPTEENALAAWFQRMADHAPLILLLGNHDRAVDFVPFSRLSTAHPIHVVTRPQIVTIGDVNVYALAYPSKLWAVGSGAIGGSIPEQKQAIEATLRQLLLEWQTDAAAWRGPERFAIGLMHINIGGSIVGGGEQHIGREVELAPHDLVELGFDVGFLSHIHKPQEMAPGWRYAGSPAMQNHGESVDEKSYILCDLAAGHAPVWTLRPTPTRKLVTVECTYEERDGVWSWQMGTTRAALHGACRDAEVRLRYRVPEEAVGICPADELAADLRNVYGAHSVKLDRQIVPKVELRAAAIAAATTTAEKLAAWCDERGVPAVQRGRLLAKLATLEDE